MTGRRYPIDKGTIILLALILGLSIVGLVDRHRHFKQDCQALETVKSAVRDLAVDKDPATKAQVLAKTRPQKC